MKFVTICVCVFVIASLVSVKCLPSEETNPILSEVQKDILVLNSSMKKIKRETRQDRQLILKLNQTMSRFTGTYEKAEPIWNNILEISPMYLDWIRALDIGFRKEKIIRIESMAGLRNLNQENHNLKQELKSVIGVLTTLEGTIENQSRQLKELQDELKESKASERELRTTLMQANKNQSQELKGLQDDLRENKNELKELQDELKELKARETAKENRKTLTGRTEIITDAETNLVSTTDDVNAKTGKFTTPFDYLFYID